MKIVLIIALLALYTYGIFRWNKQVVWRLNRKVSKSIKQVHYLALCISLVVAFSYSLFGIGLRGLWTTRTFVMIALLTGLIFNLVTDKSVVNKVEKLYFKLFSFLPALTGIVLCIPFLGAVIVVSLIGRLVEPATKIYYEDSHLRIQQSFAGVLNPPRVDIFTKTTFFEKHIYSPDFYSPDFDSLVVRHDQDSTRILIFGVPKEEFEPLVIILKKTGE